MGVVMVGAMGAFEPTLFEKHYIVPTVLEGIILMLKICTHGFKKDFEFAPIVLHS